MKSDQNYIIFSVRLMDNKCNLIFRTFNSS